MICSLEELKFKNNKNAFANRVLTDGVAVNFAFGRKAASEDSLSSVQLSLEDFTDREVNTYFQLVAVDPGDKLWAPELSTTTTKAPDGYRPNRMSNSHTKNQPYPTIPSVYFLHIAILRRTSWVL